MDTLTLIEGALSALAVARSTPDQKQRDRQLADAAAMLREARSALLDEINARHGAPWAERMNREELEKAHANFD